MARTRRSLDERIEEQEQVVSKAREHYESEVNKLEQLMNKRDELQKKELMDESLNTLQRNDNSNVLLVKTDIDCIWLDGVSRPAII